MNCCETVSQANIGYSEYRHVMSELELYSGHPRNRITVIYLVILTFVSRRKSMLP